ncbi:MAG TPA: Xaa-Pro peptidase family protein [Opitutaceae bacterium]|nr:Xaa-Pro peptidase family protein [Opitutaceae bacterium]
MHQVPLSELNDRMARFRARMDADCPDWELAAFFGRINQYYFTGTMQDAVLLVPRGGEAVLWVRRSQERARDESLFPAIRPMRSYRDALPAGATKWRTIHLETELAPLALVERFRKHFACDAITALDGVIARVRAVKSPYELAIMERCGAVHRRVQEELVPALLREGMSEAEFAGDLNSLLVQEGHQGLVRFGMFGVEMVVGQLGFGESSLYPTNFDGPAGCRGMGPAAPVLGSPEQKLRVGDLVFVDVPYGIEGYATDKTLVYQFGRALPAEVVALHRRCIEIEHRVAAALKPGAIPSEIYRRILAEQDAAFLEHFMGFGSRRVSFLGHGVGLQIDEWPVLAERFDEPLEEGMVLAVEPKRGVPGVGMVGSENTYRVTPAGGVSLTGSSPGLLLV